MSAKIFAFETPAEIEVEISRAETVNWLMESGGSRLDAERAAAVYAEALADGMGRYLGVKVSVELTSVRGHYIHPSVLARIAPEQAAAAYETVTERLGDDMSAWLPD